MAALKIEYAAMLLAVLVIFVSACHNSDDTASVEDDSVFTVIGEDTEEGLEEQEDVGVGDYAHIFADKPGDDDIVAIVGAERRACDHARRLAGYG